MAARLFDTIVASLPFFLILMSVLVAAPGCTGDTASSGRKVAGPASDDPLVRFPAGLPQESGQVILVTGKATSVSLAEVRTYQRAKGGWVPALPPFDAVAGRNGFAEVGAKREGDGKTPSGIFPLEFTFGYAPAINTKMPYRQATNQDIWVDDPNSMDYNRWVRRGETDAASFEELRRKDNLYKYGIVIGYNRNPVVKGHGSAIFVHLWKNRETPTSGCIAMAEENLQQILTWLDPAQKPVIMLRQ
jgi:L,D-peptidoglycan transpeptidase YkuD (ErfK/YbiS/YcfS/YnhG family)